MAASPAQITLARLTEGGGIMCLVYWFRWISGRRGSSLVVCWQRDSRQIRRNNQAVNGACALRFSQMALGWAVNWTGRTLWTMQLHGFLGEQGSTYMVTI